MSGANNIPLGSRGGGGSLAAAASTLGGVSLLNPSYLDGENHSAPGSGRRSKFGPPVDGKTFQASWSHFVLILKGHILQELDLHRSLTPWTNRFARDLIWTLLTVSTRP